MPPLPICRDGEVEVLCHQVFGEKKIFYCEMPWVGLIPALILVKVHIK